MSNAVQFAIAGDLKTGGKYPHIPIRWLLQSKLREHLGITPEDDIELQERAEADRLKAAGEEYEKFETEFELSGETDAYALSFVKWAAIGLCWPPNDALKCPSLGACHHDVVEYGAGVYDVMYARYAVAKGKKSWQKDGSTQGQKLIHEMCAHAANLLVTEVAKQKDFTEDRGALSTAK